eukprot:TRINITY_DN1372_c0_g3_i1.p1 TRINITY_DN1372_c0_g3~~TRINITY_DN1372_c0_g3_i1.p1  ORF type:complete len:306 (-),score=69.50 TRINITY_DN1372_c0_g3_i1:35-928(-)
MSPTKFRGTTKKESPTLLTKVEEKKIRGSESWFSENPSKRWAEIFFLKWSVVWISIFVVVVGTKMYENFRDLEYMTLGIVVSFPIFLYPYFFPGKEDQGRPLKDRYWVKANIWIWIISFIGNYFWTHYFYTILQAKYTFPIEWQLNRVPFCLYLVTHAYFTSYHTVTTIILRRFYRRISTFNLNFQLVMTVGMVFILAYITAFMEAFTISSVPYYNYPDATKMYVIGSAFYGIYFYVSFPMFYHVDEKRTDNWTLGYTTIHSFAACMMVTTILDFWRIILGGLHAGVTVPETLPWLV